MRDNGRMARKMEKVKKRERKKKKRFFLFFVAFILFIDYCFIWINNYVDWWNYLHQKGKTTWPDTSKYEGDWKDDKKDGEGTKKKDQKRRR